MSLETEYGVKISRSHFALAVPEGTGIANQTIASGLVTGEGTFPVRNVSVNLGRPSNPHPAKGKNGKKVEDITPAIRRALARHWKEALQAAQEMNTAAFVQEPMDLGIAADKLDQALAELWNLREFRDINWQCILNHAQGMLRCFFQKQCVEFLGPSQGQAIVELVKDHLGPATKTKEDLNEALRLIEDAGFDPFAAISGEPVCPEEK